MIDITLQNFQTELMAASQAQPVLLDIWAPWCGPCKTLGPVLEKLEVAYAGRFKLAKLNADDVPELAGQLSQMFGVRSIPFCVMFKGGQPVDGFVGALPEADIRQFLDKHVDSVEVAEAAEDVEAAEALLASGDVESAIERLQEAVQLAPDNEATRAELMETLLRQGLLAQARAAYEPVARHPLLGARLSALGHWLTACEQSATAPAATALQTAIAANKRDFAARFALAQHHFAARQDTAALDELLEILMRDKTWHEDSARKTYVAILELMAPPTAPKAPGSDAPRPVPGSPAAAPKLEIAGKFSTAPADPVIDGYRRKLSMTLF